MSRVVLVRHAQASFGSGDYDRLSEHGMLQAQRLGAYLATQRDRHFVRLVSGSLHRHAQTVAAIEQAFANCNLSLPACAIDPDWNEFDHTAVIRAFAQLHPSDPNLISARAGDKRAMFAVLSAALHAWSRDELQNVPETWNGFATRVARARSRLEHGDSSGIALVISSGGVISRCAQAALGIDDRRTVELNLGLRNTAIGEFRVIDTAWQMLTWNTLPHFAGSDEAAWVTYY
jgi:broad specificity phosphatase PhoE